MSYLATLNRDVDGSYIDRMGCTFPDAEDAIRDVLGFCGCGIPAAALALVRDALRLANLRGPSDYAQFSAWHRDVRQPRRHAVFGGDLGTEYLTWYLLDDKGLTEHGTSLPGWLTELGKGVLADLEAMDLPDAEQRVEAES